jgi:hypothetical protein
MPESMSPPLAATPCGPLAVSSGSVPPRSPETSLYRHSKPLIRHLPARGWARGAPLGTLEDLGPFARDGRAGDGQSLHPRGSGHQVCARRR